ncbi:MAG: fibronectin type III domain-containing protein [Chloroflexi bacterium]|nr:fibronectin type III domain-containing protein [Chloroflexota bacterium]
MKTGHPGSGPHSSFRWSRIYAAAAVALALVLAVVFTTALSITDISRADGPPILGADFSLPMKLEQGRPAPVLRSSGPRQAPTPVVIPPETPTPEADPPTLLSTERPAPPVISVSSYGVLGARIEWAWPVGVNRYQVQFSADGVSWRLLAQRTVDDKAENKPPTLHALDQGLGYRENRHYRVRAGSGELWSDWSKSAYISTRTYSPPNLAVEALSTTSLRISWQAYGDRGRFTGWELQVASDQAVLVGAGTPVPDEALWQPLKNDLAADARTYTHSGLTAGDTRFYRIRPLTEGGPEDWYDTVQGATFQSSTPAAPRLTTRADGALRIVLTWTKPSGRGFDITGYDLEISEDGRDWIPIGPAWADSTTLTTGVPAPGTTRFFRIRANNTQGLGRWSGAVRGVSAGGGADAPTGLAATAQYDEKTGAPSIKLTWKAPWQEEGAPPITSYNVQRKREDGNWALVNVAGKDSRTFEDKRVEPGAFYQYRVAARDSGGLGRWSNTAHVSAKALVPDAPRLTVRAMCRRAGDASELPCISAPISDSGRPQVWIELSWTEPDDNGDEILGYRLERSPNGRDQWKSAGDINNEDHDVGYGETWHYRVRAVSGEGDGAWSPVVRATTRSFVPYLPSYLQKGPEMENAIQLNWQGPEDDGGRSVTEIEIQFSTRGYLEQANWRSLVYTGRSVGTHTHRNLRQDTEYCYRIRARNSLGWSGWGLPARAPSQCFRLRPAAPSIKVQGFDINQAKVSWTEPDSLGFTLTAYEFAMSPNGLSWPGHLVASYGLGVKAVYPNYQQIRRDFLRDLTATRVAFRVRVRTEEGTKSDWSEVVATSLIPPPAPAVTLETGDTGVTVSWTATANPNQKLSGFQLDVSPNGTNWGYALTSHEPDVRSVDLTYTLIGRYVAGWNPETVYIRVRAKALDGRESPWSTAVTVAMPSG